MVQYYRAKAIEIYTQQVTQGLQLSDIAPTTDDTTEKRICGRRTYNALIKGEKKKAEIFERAAGKLNVSVESLCYREGEPVSYDDEAIACLGRGSSVRRDNTLLDWLCNRFGNKVADPVLAGVVYSFRKQAESERNNILAELRSEFAGGDNAGSTPWIEEFLDYLSKAGPQPAISADQDDSADLKTRCRDFLRDSDPAVEYFHDANNLDCEKTAEAVVNHIFDDTASEKRLILFYNCCKRGRDVENWNEICLALRASLSCVTPSCMNLATYAAVQRYVVSGMNLHGSQAIENIPTSKTFVAQCVVGHISGLPVAPPPNIADPPEDDCIDAMSAPPERASSGEEAVLKQFEQIVRRHVEPWGQTRADTQAALKRRSELDKHWYVVLFTDQHKFCDDDYNLIKDPKRGFPQLILFRHHTAADSVSANFDAELFDMFCCIYSYFTP